jgi:hypothetical protein
MENALPPNGRLSQWIALRSLPVLRRLGACWAVPTIHSGLKLLLAAAIAGVWLLASPRPAAAQLVQSCQGAARYLDLNHDGKPEAMVLNCTFSPGMSDQLTIYKPSGRLSASIPWQQNITYEDETWVFDHGTQGRASLIIVFRKDQKALVAELYDDRDQDGSVSYQVQDGKVKISENRFWTVQVTASDGWWVRDGVINYNLHILVDGDVEGMFMMETYRASLKTDGKPDYDIQIYDQNHNGRPEFDKRMILTGWLQGSVGLGTQMMANWADDEPPISGGFSLWPYLDLNHQWKSGSRVVKGQGVTPAPIMFEPGTGRIEAIGEFVASRGGEHNCFYYSAKRWTADTLNETDFESPFCFYDLAGVYDGTPELQVRAVYWPPKDFPFLQGTVPDPYELIRYSWDQDNSTSWRYAIGLVGQHTEDSEVIFPDNIHVLTIHYNEFPTWVTQHTWKMAVFSEFTGKAYWTNEGVYAVSYPELQMYSKYFTGQSGSMPSPEVEPEVDFKMEWAMNYNRQPTLYFSAVDRRLHLLGASGGAWKIDQHQSIQYENLGGGDLINQWNYLVDGLPEKSLIALSGFFFLSDGSALAMKFSDAPRSLFVTLPPTNHTEWLKLGSEINQGKPAFAPDDFQAMLAQFGSADGSIQGAALRDLRLTQGGFRFILSLQRGFRLSGEDVLGLTKITSGDYAVSYDGAFHVQPLTPANLQISFPAAATAGNSLTKNATNSLYVIIRNTGLTDVQAVSVSAEFVGPGIKLSMPPQTTSVLAGESATLTFSWLPEAAGAWQARVQADILDASGNATRILSAASQLQVAPAPAGMTFQQALSAFGLAPGWAVLLLLAAVVLGGGALGWTLWK